MACGKWRGHSCSRAIAGGGGAVRERLATGNMGMLPGVAGYQRERISCPGRPRQSQAAPCLTRGGSAEVNCLLPLGHRSLPLPGYEQLTL